MRVHLQLRRVKVLQRLIRTFARKSSIARLFTIIFLGHSNPLATMKAYAQVIDKEIDKSGVALAEYMKKVS